MTYNHCDRCLGPLVGDDGVATMNHDWLYGYFGKTICALNTEERSIVARLQLEGGRY